MKALHVVVLVLENQHAQILVAQRPLDKHQGGLWEFPGGKVEVGEQPIQALRREIREELDYDLKQADPLMSLTHSYPELTVNLAVWYSVDMAPEVCANESQPLKWVTKQQLLSLDMPSANQPIIDAILSQS